nr:bifunctional biotin--[acetyl-CoA-carboxylase] ligase/biotin operon repressor BirA [Kangiella sp. HZ709]
MVVVNSQTAHKEQQLSQIIQLLSDGQCHSGQKLAEELEVSRAYVWKLIQQLQEYGLELESVSGKGYLWQSPSALLDSKKFIMALGALNISHEYDFLMDSTNQRLKEKFKDKHLVITEYQTAGRGRRGRNWQSPLATNLYFSYGWKTEQPVQQLGGLSLVVGISIVEALDIMGFEKLQLKWPNDVRVEQQKLAGILVELTGDAAGDLEVIIGIGLNVNMQSQQETIEQEWTSLANLSGRSIDRQAILVFVLKQLQINLKLFEQEGFAAFQQSWNQYDESFNKRVEVHQSNGVLHGTAKGVNKSGALLLEYNNEIKPIFAGEVSLKVEAS